MQHTTPPSRPSLLLAMLLSAMAGGMGWGIRGQYGHETGAMIAGVLVGLVLVLMFLPQTGALRGARAVALCALGISLGGSMTYGQTVGLTHDAELVGNWAALRWGLLGLFLKGGIWIAFAAAFLGMALGERRYSPLEWAMLLLVMFFLLFLGIYLLNQPFNPTGRELPRIYFSDHWHWEPDADLEPRRERWGGLLAALLGLVAYVAFVKRDRLAWRLACWGFLGGGLGFSLGQSLQAWHAWNREMFAKGWFGEHLEPYMNWWNMMETTFGAIFGAVLALALWLHWRMLRGDAKEKSHVEITAPAEWLLVAVHVAALAVWNFASFAYFDLFADQAISMILIPTLAVVAGRSWPFLLTLPIMIFPIAGKTVRQLVYEEQAATISLQPGWILYFAIPLVVASLTAVLLARKATQQATASFARVALLLATWILFGLNHAFFHYPWPWEEWTGRTPNGILFSVFAIVLSLAALVYRPRAPANAPLPEIQSPSTSTPPQQGGPEELG